MAFPTANTTHQIQALARFIEQYKEKPLYAALLDSYIKQVQDLENATFEVLNGRLLDIAIGVQLDVLGDLIGEARQGRQDNVYRQAIRTRIRINRSFGTPVDVLVVARLILGTAFPTIRYNEAYPATILISFDRTLSPLERFGIDRFMLQTKAAGVQLSFTEVLDPDNAFTFNQDPGAVNVAAKGFSYFDRRMIGVLFTDNTVLPTEEINLDALSTENADGGLMRFYRELDEGEIDYQIRFGATSQRAIFAALVDPKSYSFGLIPTLSFTTNTFTGPTETIDALRPFVIAFLCFESTSQVVNSFTIDDGTSARNMNLIAEFATTSGAGTELKVGIYASPALRKNVSNTTFTLDLDVAGTVTQGKLGYTVVKDLADFPITRSDRDDSASGADDLTIFVERKGGRLAHIQQATGLIPVPVQFTPAIYDAWISAELGIITTGVLIDTAQNQGSAGVKFDFSQTGVERPVLKSNATPSGLKSIEFDSVTGQFMTSPDITPDLIGEISVCMVIKYNAVDQSTAFDGLDLQNSRRGFNQTPDQYSAEAGGETLSVTGPTQDGTNWVIHTIVFDDMNSKMQINHEAPAFGDLETGFATGFVLGARGVLLDQEMDGEIAEWVMFRGRWTSSQISELVNFFANRHGITV